MLNEIVPDEAVDAPGIFPPDATNMEEGPDEHTLASAGVMLTVAGELATVTVVVV